MLHQLFLVVLVSPAVISQKTAHIFLIAGQSNSEGFNSDGHTSEDVSYPNIWQLDCCYNGTTLPADQCKFITAKDPLHHQCDEWFLTNITVGYGMSFARSFREDVGEDDVVILVPSGVGGTGYFDGTWTAYKGWGFNAAVNKLKQAYNLIQKNYADYNPKFQGIVWQQGTHDAGDNTWGYIANTTYYLYEDILPMISAFRDTEVLPFTYPELPFLCANLMPAWVANPDHPLRMGVFNAIALVDQLSPYTATVSSIGLVGDPAFPAGNDHELVHFTAKSQRLLGKRYHSAYYSAKLNAPV